MDHDEIPSVQFENDGIPNNRDIDYIYQYYASLEQAREARQQEAATAIAEQTKLDSGSKAQDDDSSSSSDDSDSTSDSDSDDDAPSNVPHNENAATKVETAPSEAQSTDKEEKSQAEPAAEKDKESSEPQVGVAGPSEAADSLAAQLLAKHTSDNAPTVGEDAKADGWGSEKDDAEDDDDDDDNSSEEGTDFRLTHEELEEMILREDGEGKNPKPPPEPEDSEPAPKFPTITVQEEDTIETVGTLHAFIGKSLHFWQDTEHEQSEENDRILLEGSVICLEDRRVLGGIFDMMGPMRAKKLYQIKYDKEKFQEIKSWELERGTKLYRVVAHSTWGHVNQFTAGDEAFDEVYEGDDDEQMADIDDAEVLMRRAQDGGRGGKAGRRGGGARDRGRARGRDRRGQGHPRGHNQFRSGRGAYSSSDQASRPYSQPAPQHDQNYRPPSGHGQPAMNPQHFQALFSQLQQAQQQAQQQQGTWAPQSVTTQPYQQPFINHNFQQPAFNPFAWAANMAANGQTPPMPPVPPMPQFAGFQQPQYPQNAYNQQTNQTFQPPSVPQFGSALPQAPSYQEQGRFQGRGGRGGRGARGGPRIRHPDDPSEHY